MKLTRRLLEVVAFALLAGCTMFGEARAMFAQLFALQQQLQKEFPGETIRVTESTGGRLAVELVNSRLATLSGDERAERTRAIATYARNHYARIAGISVISVVFKSESGAAGVTFSSSDATDYAIADLEATAAPTVVGSATPAPDTVKAQGAVHAAADTAGHAAAASGIKSISHWKSF
jgi:hypothetical protein